jgi:hypothetical protein
MQVLSRFSRGGAIGFGINFILMTLWLAALVWQAARVDLDVVGGVLFGIGFLFMAVIMGAFGWLSLASLFRSPALWVEGGELVCVAPLPVRVRLDDIVDYKFQMVQAGRRQLIWSVRLHLSGGRRRHVSLIMLDGTEAVITCLRHRVPNVGQGTAPMEPVVS